MLSNSIPRLLRHVEALNRYDLTHFHRFSLNDQPIGWIRPAVVPHLMARWSAFQIEGAEVKLHLPQADPAAVTDGLMRLVADLVVDGLVPRQLNELYPLGPSRREPVGLIDRGAVALFGIHAYGQHLNGYLRRGRQLWMWIGERARDRHHEPGKLDQLVAGGLPFGISLHANLLKECHEEAGIPAELAAQAVAVGSINYCVETEAGLKIDTMFHYDLELPESFTPHCTDGEVERFHLLPLEEVAEIVASSDAFKRNCNLTVIDFLIRHGYLSPEEEGYHTLQQQLRPLMRGLHYSGNTL